MPFDLNIYQHYKGNYYHIVLFGRHTETDEELAIYREVFSDNPNPTTWVRPLKMFSDKVPNPSKRCYDLDTTDRFSFIGNLITDKDSVIWEYGLCSKSIARRHKTNGEVQFVLWKAGEQGHTEDYWHPFGYGHAEFFRPNSWMFGKPTAPSKLSFFNKLINGVKRIFK